MKTLGIARSRIRFRISEPEPSFWTDPELNSYINDAKDDLYNAIVTINKDFFQKRAYKTYLASADGLLMPSDFQRMKKLSVPGQGTAFIYADRSSPQFSTGGTLSDSSYFYDLYDCADVPAEGAPDLRGWTLVLAPSPSSNLNLLVEYCAQLPDLVEDSDTFSFMDPFIGYILDKATYYALSKGPSGDYSNYASSAELKMNRILAVASKSTVDSDDFVEGFMED